MKAVQYFTDQQLEYGSKLSPAQTLRFLEDFRRLHAARPAVVPGRATLISLRVPDPLLRAFRVKAAAAGVPYQTQIKRLMQTWITEPEDAK